jgi:hypothetical protein
MKYLATTILGLVTGAVAACALLYYNPLTATGTRAPTTGDWTLSYRFPTPDTLLLAHRGGRSLREIPAGVPRLWEETISRTGIGVVSLRDADGHPAALATRISVPSVKTDLLLAGAIVSDYWLITVPGNGSLFVEADSNLWPFLKEAYLPVRYFGRPWQGPSGYTPTVGPVRSGSARVSGASGRYAGVRGDAVETVRVEALGATGELKALAGSLHLRLPAAEPAVTAVAD